MRVAFIVEYDGTDYAGWQKQKNDITVQQKIEEALLTLGKGHITVTGAGRTDSGVHAKGQCGHFDIDSDIPASKFMFILNTRLPKDIRIKKTWKAENDFHSRFSAKGKRYIYRIFNATYSSALMGRYTMHVPEALDIEKMQQAAEYIVGTHDFKAFCAQGSSVKTTVRTVNKVEVKKENELIEITVEGTGFLYNMVRIIAGTLIEVGKNKKTPLQVKEIIEGKIRKEAGMTADAQGLTMDEVFY